MKAALSACRLVPRCLLFATVLFCITGFLLLLRTFCRKVWVQLRVSFSHYCTYDPGVCSIFLSSWAWIRVSSTQHRERVKLFCHAPEKKLLNSGFHSPLVSRSERKTPQLRVSSTTHQAASVAQSAQYIAHVRVSSTVRWQSAVAD